MFSLARCVTPPWDVYVTNCHPGWQGYPTWQTGQPTLAGYPTYRVNVVKIKWEIIRKGGLPHPPRVPHLYVNRPWDSKTSLVTPIPTRITRLQSAYQNITFLQISKNLYLQFTNTFIFSSSWHLYHNFSSAQGLFLYTDMKHAILPTLFFSLLTLHTAVTLLKIL